MNNRRMILDVTPFPDHGHTPEGGWGIVHPAETLQDQLQKALQRQTATIDLTAVKVKIGMEQTAKLYQQGLDIFDQSAGQLLATCEGERHPEHQALVDLYCTAMTQGLAGDIAQLIQIGTKRIGEEVGRKL